MAVPKSKQSKMRTNSRCSANFYATAPTLVECPQCHALKEAHRVCKKCGYYDKVSVIPQEEKKKKD
ncbi:MAG: 50S ribosomal protein L32 [Clostridia bacterium]|nr:50S ribosomal protein L32 [Clostridia bacterium]